MPVWQAILLGVVQGLTEFLPVSSTAHLLIVQELLGRAREEVQADPFTVVIQLGTLFAVFAYFRRDVIALLRAAWDDFRHGRLLASGSPDGRTVRLIVVGTIPAGVAGLVLKKWLKATFYNPTAIAWVAVVFALLMAAAEWWAARRRRLGKPAREEGDVTYADALFVGLFQAMALMPGGSRSGTTITAALFAGLTRPAAARFSFLLSLPITLAAGLKDLADWLKDVAQKPEFRAAAGDQATAMLVGTLVSAIVGYLSIAWLMGYLRRYSMLAFVGYRLIFAAAVLALIAAGVIRP
jgi:undecaprenyl-diphosphatase